MPDTYKNLFVNLFKSVAACEAPEGTQVDDVLGGFQRFYDEAEKAKAPWSIEVDDDGSKHTKCPNCGSFDTIVEVDQAVRFNELVLNGKALGYRNSVVARVGEEGDWDFHHWFCTFCITDKLVAPIGFEIEEWV